DRLDLFAGQIAFLFVDSVAFLNEVADFARILIGILLADLVYQCGYSAAAGFIVLWRPFFGDFSEQRFPRGVFLSLSGLVMLRDKRRDLIRWDIGVLGVDLCNQLGLAAIVGMVSPRRPLLFNLLQEIVPGSLLGFGLMRATGRQNDLYASVAHRPDRHVVEVGWVNAVLE